MKKIILLFITIISAFLCKAQDEDGQKFGFGTEAGYMRGYTNLTSQHSHAGVNFNLIYNYTPYLPVVAELQWGELSGGGLKPSEDKYGRSYDNRFFAFIIHVDFRLDGIIDADGPLFSTNVHSPVNFIKNFYIGTGAGVISNNVQAQRYSIYAPVFPNPGYYRFPGTSQSFNAVIPIRFGYEIKIYNGLDNLGYAIDIGYVHNIVFGSGLDGYNDPSSHFRHLSADQYRQFTIGFKHYLTTK